VLQQKKIQVASIITPPIHTINTTIYFKTTCDDGIWTMMMYTGTVPSVIFHNLFVYNCGYTCNIVLKHNITKLDPNILYSDELLLLFETISKNKSIAPKNAICNVLFEIVTDP
jgi:hypothetical protein